MTRRGNGEGTIGTWRGRYRAAIRNQGGRQYFYGRTRKEAQKKLNAARRALEDGRQFGSANQRVGHYLESWLKDRVRRTVRASTYDSYALNVERVRPYIGDIPLDTLRAQHLDHCYAELERKGLSARSIAQAHTVLRAAFRQAVKAGRLAISPTFAASPPKPKRTEMRTLTEEQVGVLFRYTAHDRLHALWRLLITTGLREGEATGLMWEDIDWEAGTLSLRRSVHRIKGKGLVVGELKTKQSRHTVHLSRDTLQALRRHDDRQKLEKRKAQELWLDPRLVFCTELGGILDVGYVRQSLHRALAGAGLPLIRTHDLRHTCATILLRKGTHPKVVQDLLGHSSISQTLDTYSHVVPALHQEAAAQWDGSFQVHESTV